MPASPVLVQRVRETIGLRDGITERRMFGGVTFLVHGNMACAVRGEDLMVRLEADDIEDALAERHVQRMASATGRRVLTTFVLVDALGIESDADLARWVDAGANYAAGLPRKPDASA